MYFRIGLFRALHRCLIVLSGRTCFYVKNGPIPNVVCYLTFLCPQQGSVCSFVALAPHLLYTSLEAIRHTASVFMSINVSLGRTYEGTNAHLPYLIKVYCVQRLAPTANVSGSPAD